MVPRNSRIARAFVVVSRRKIEEDGVLFWMCYDVPLAVCRELRDDWKRVFSLECATRYFVARVL